MFKGGISGAKIELLSNGIIRKWATAGQENRLRRQAEKQQSFENNSIIKVPKILNIGFNYIDMEYIRGLSVIDFLNRAGKIQLDWLITIIAAFIFSCWQPGYQDVSANVINKAKSLGYKITLEEPLILPNGIGHGDCTFSNLIFGQNLQEVYLIDFLDGYIESPIIDLVKLRQSTHLLWDLFIHNQLGNVKARIALDYLDHHLLEIFDIPHYNTLQKINLYRILPYCKSQKQKDHIESLLEKLC